MLFAVRGCQRIELALCCMTGLCCCRIGFPWPSMIVVGILVSVKCLIGHRQHLHSRTRSESVLAICNNVVVTIRHLLPVLSVRPLFPDECGYVVVVAEHFRQHKAQVSKLVVIDGYENGTVLALAVCVKAQRVGTSYRATCRVDSGLRLPAHHLVQPALDLGVVHIVVVHPTFSPVL